MTHSADNDATEAELRLRYRAAVDALIEATRQRDEAERALDAYLDSRVAPPGQDQP